MELNWDMNLEKDKRNKGKGKKIKEQSKRKFMTQSHRSKSRNAYDS